MKVRPYSKHDRNEVLKLLDANTPAFFEASERADLEKYLDSEVEDYFVVEENGRIIGAGGINYFKDESKARISWDFIHPDAHGKGIGTTLTQYRLDHLKKQPTIERVEVRTSQLAYVFYEKMGFKLLRIEEDFWAQGYHLYQMEQRNV